MRCQEIREILEEFGVHALSAEARDHVMRCADCRATARHWGVLTAGFQALAQELPPEATTGFAERLCRLLGPVADAPRAWGEYLEAAGRRFVYAAFVFATLSVLALALPSTGPLRAPSSADLYMAQTDVAPGSDAVFSPETSDAQEVLPRSPNPGTENGQK